MNKQTITGFVIIGLILFGFSWFQGNQQKKAEAEFAETKRIEDSVAHANAPRQTIPTIDTTLMATLPADTLDVARTLQADPLGETLATAREAKGETFTVENDVMSIEFSTLGGIVSDVVLKDYQKYGGEPLHLWKPGSEEFDISLFLRRDGRDAQLNTSEFNFVRSVGESAEGKVVSMKLPVSGDGGAYIEFVYTIPQAGYMLGYQVRFVGMEGLMSNQSSFDIDWSNTSLRNEKGFDNENNYTTIAYHYPDVKGIEDLSIARAGGSKQQSEASRVQWVAFKQQFFSSILIADEAFQGADMGYETHQPGDGEIKDFHAKLSVPMSAEAGSYGFRLYLGPNKFSTLKQHDLGMERLISMGWMSFGWVSRAALIPLFEWLSRGGLGIGWVILFMTLIVKLVIFPITITSYISSAKMRVIKPEVDEINAKYPDQVDAMKKQQATMELYRKAGINPLAGCIPMLIQFPIIIAMFRFFPSAIELRGRNLWWAEDLSSYDSILNLPFNIPFYGNHVSMFALLTAVSMFFYSWMNFKQQAAQPQMAGMKFMMLYMMPVFTLFLLNNFSSGLCYYYLLGNLFTMAQMYGVRWFINEDKIRQKMLARPVKAKKKSGFMARLEEAQRARLETARQQQTQQGRASQNRPAQSKNKR